MALPAAEVALGVVTVMLVAPAAPGGATAVIEVAELMVKLVAAVAPKDTALAPARLVPVRVTLVPPAIAPVDGDTLVTVGAAAHV